MLLVGVTQETAVSRLNQPSKSNVCQYISQMWNAPWLGLPWSLKWTEKSPSKRTVMRFSQFSVFSVSWSHLNWAINWIWLEYPRSVANNQTLGRHFSESCILVWPTVVLPRKAITITFSQINFHHIRRKIIIWEIMRKETSCMNCIFHVIWTQL